MLSTTIFILLLATGVICVPVMVPGQGIGMTRRRVNTRQEVTYVEYVQSDPNNPNSMEETRRYTEGGDNAVTAAQIVPEQASSAPAEPITAGSHDGNAVPNDGSSPASGNSMLEVINQWRSAYGLKELQWSPSMVEAAENTGKLNNGNAWGFQHRNPSDAGEVMAPGSDNDKGQDLRGHSPFEISYISLLCEVPNGPVADSCPMQNQIMSM